MLDPLVRNWKWSGGSSSYCEFLWVAVVHHRAAWSQDTGISVMAWTSNTWCPVPLQSLLVPFVVQLYAFCRVPCLGAVYFHVTGGMSTTLAYIQMHMRKVVTGLLMVVLDGVVIVPSCQTSWTAALRRPVLDAGVPRTCPGTFTQWPLSRCGLLLSTVSFPVWASSL